MTTKELIDACDLQWQHVGNEHAACRFCGFVVWVGADATIDDHMKKCGPLAAPPSGGES